MTLIVSLRIPDGIVIAGDSLATMINQRNAQVEIPVKCPQCRKVHIETVQLPMPSASTTFSYAQKVLPFMKEFGVGTFGIGLLGGKSIYFAIRELEQELNETTSKEPGKKLGLKEVSEKIGEHMLKLVDKQLEIENAKRSDMSDDWRPLGFQIVGYENSVPSTIQLDIGKEIKTKEIQELGCTFSGSGEVVHALWSTYENESMRPPFGLFSLQDAIAYAEFLIGTTAQHQRFSISMPNVGGEIDIGLVTPFNGFQWIKQKEIGQILEKGREDG